VPRVDPSSALLRHGRARWPESGERPDVGDFELGPLSAAVFECERRFDQLAPESPGSPIRLLVVPASGLFPVIVFYAMEIAVAPDADRRVELLDFTVDDGYWDVIDDDPER
jgi:hypothetical protein